jgi:hypothetical protein
LEFKRPLQLCRSCGEHWSFGAAMESVGTAMESVGTAVDNNIKR